MEDIYESKESCSPSSEFLRSQAFAAKLLVAVPGPNRNIRAVALNKIRSEFIENFAQPTGTAKELQKDKHILRDKFTQFLRHIGFVNIPFQPASDAPACYSGKFNLHAD